MEYIYWIGDMDEGMGAWQSRRDAEIALRTMQSHGMFNKHARVIRYKAGRCGCGRLERADVLKDLGECMYCDHIREEQLYDR